MNNVKKNKKRDIWHITYGVTAPFYRPRHKPSKYIIFFSSIWMCLMCKLKLTIWFCLFFDLLGTQYWVHCCIFQYPIDLFLFLLFAVIVDVSSIRAFLFPFHFNVFVIDLISLTWWLIIPAIKMNNPKWNK